MIIDDIGKVIRWKAVRLHQNLHITTITHQHITMVTHQQCSDTSQQLFTMDGVVPATATCDVTLVKYFYNSFYLN